MRFTYQPGGKVEVHVSNAEVLMLHREVVEALNGPAALPPAMVEKLTRHRKFIEAEMRRRGL